MRASPLPRKTARISDSLHRQLNAYALAASSAGVATLALSIPAQAKIVYTRTYRLIQCCGSSTLDLNHDGKGDFQFKFSNPNPYLMNLAVFPLQSGNQVWGATLYASALAAGVSIKSDWRFQPGHPLMASWYSHGTSGSRGKWVNVQNRYLGLKFFINGKIHYGWARLSVQVHPGSITATLTGYAYETIANKGIISGKTKGANRGVIASEAVADRRDQAAASLGLLASGYSGLTIWRRPTARQ
jgi:hypothetical protein